jgi:hypothetical protein
VQVVSCLFISADAQEKQKFNSSSVYLSDMCSLPTVLCRETLKDNADTYKFSITIIKTEFLMISLIKLKHPEFLMIIITDCIKRLVVRVGHISAL